MNHFSYQFDLPSMALAEAEKRIEQVLDLKEKNLDLRGLGLTELPNAIGRATHLKSLNLIENHLETVPKSIENLLQLDSLYLQRNELTSIPEPIAKLTKLRTLW